MPTPGCADETYKTPFQADSSKKTPEPPGDRPGWRPEDSTVSSTYRIVRAVPDVLIFADTVRSPELRHEIPLAIPDPFLYLERNGSRHVVIGSLELPRVRLLDGLEVHPLEEFGYDELVRSGLSRAEIRDELNARACQALGVGSAAVPSGFPLEVADSLRAGGLELAADSELFDARRRVKNEARARRDAPRTACGRGGHGRGARALRAAGGR